MSESPLSVSNRDPEAVVESSSSPLPPLHVGTTLLDRFTVVALLSSNDGANVYRAALAQPCPNCGVENEGGATQCGFCGKGLPTPRTVALIERALPANGQLIPSSFVSNGLSYAFLRDPATAVTKSTLQLSYSFATDQGLVRGTRGEPNEDCVLALHLSTRHAAAASTLALFSVADGVGGAAAGEVASEMATRIVAHELLTRLLAPSPEPLSGELVRDTLRAAIHEANTAVLDYAHAHGVPLGTTLTLALVVDERVFFANVGDSRTYLYREDTLTQITRDHSYIARLLERGEINADEARVHPQRNLILRSVGDATGYDVDLFPQAEEGLLLEAGDTLMLCSDGLWEMVTDEEIAGILAQGLDAPQTCAQLVSFANAAGGADNISVVIVQATRV